MHGLCNIMLTILFILCVGTLKKAIIDGGYVDQMLKYTDTPTRVATALTLSHIATRWFGMLVLDTVCCISPDLAAYFSWRDEVHLPGQ